MAKFVEFQIKVDNPKSNYTPLEPISGKIYATNKENTETKLKKLGVEIHETYYKYRAAARQSGGNYVSGWFPQDEIKSKAKVLQAPIVLAQKRP